MASQQSFDRTPKHYPQNPPIPIVVPEDVYYSDHNNFKDAAKLQFTAFYQDISAFYKTNPAVLNPNQGNEIIPTMPWKLGTDNREQITNDIDKYLEVFFDKYLKGFHSKKLKRACKNPQAIIQNRVF
jgi:hypothetical protein